MNGLVLCHRLLVLLLGFVIFKFRISKRSAGVSVDSLVDYMSLYQKGDETREERLGILEEEKQKLEERLSQLQTALNRLNLKIKLYKEGKF